MQYCREFFPDNMPVTVRHLFENERPQEEEICMTWSETYNLPHRPEPPKPHCPLMPHHHHHPPMPVHKTGWIPGPPPPMGKPFWQGPAYPKPPHHHHHHHHEHTVDKDYQNPSALDIAISEIISVCPGFESWVQTCETGCEECLLKSYVENSTNTPDEENPETPVNPETPTEGDSTETGSEEPPTDSKNPPANDDTPDNTEEETPADPVDPNPTEPDASVTEGGTEDIENTESDTTNESNTEDVTPETTEDPIQTATTLMS